MTEHVPVFRIRQVEMLPDTMPLSTSRLRELGIRGLHCGCADNLRSGWLSIDEKVFADEQGNATQYGRVARCNGSCYYLRHDLATVLPIEDAAFEWAYAEHFIEHLPPQAAIAWLSDVRRLLRPSGLLRVSTPDLQRYVQGYLDPNGGFFDEHQRHLSALTRRAVPRRSAWMLNQIFFGWGHRWIYDFDELLYVAEAAGFSRDAISRRAFHAGLCEEVALLDRSIRRDESLYVEMVKA